MSGKEIIPLFDAPHLIKGIRNNLLTKDLELYFRKPTEERLKASWRIIVLMYLIDQQINVQQELKNITIKHIIFNKRNKQKMRVKLAAQVLSSSVAKFIEKTISKQKVSIIFNDFNLLQ